MIFILGGAYQGKLDFAKQQFHVTPSEIWDGRSFLDVKLLHGADSEEESLWMPDLEKRVWNGLEYFALVCVDKGLEARGFMEERREALRDKILICTDLSQGVVPMEARMRAWREMNGRMNIYLASQAEQVYRLFCGIPKRIK